MPVLPVQCKCHCHTSGGRCGIASCCAEAGIPFSGHEPVPERDHLTDDELELLSREQIAGEEKRIMDHHWTNCQDCMARLGKLVTLR